MNRVILFFALATGLFSATALAEDQAQLLVRCLLNKSNSLNVYRVVSQPSEMLPGARSSTQLKFEVENFLGDKQVVLTMDRPHIVEYGDVLIALEDQGRSGYILFRFQKNTTPPEGEIGDATVFIDNDSFLHRDNTLFSYGAFIRIPDCIAAKEGMI